MSFDVGSVTAHVNADISNFQDGMAKVKQSVTSAGDAVGNIRGKLDGFVGSVFNLKNAIIGAGVGLLAKDVIESGIAYDRLNKTLEVVAQNVGVTTGELADMRTALLETNTMGSEATKTMLRFLQSGLQGSVDFKKFIGVTKDFAASVGVSSAQAIDNFTQSIVSLRPELLENYGIQFNLTDVYARFAEEQGLRAVAMTAEQKRLALLNEVYRQGANVQGVYAKTYETAGKNILSISDRIKELKEYLGIIFIPALAGVTNFIQKSLRTMVEWFMNNQDTIQAWSDAFKAFVETTGQRFMDFFMAALPTLQKFGDWIIKNKDMVITFVTGLGIALGTLLILATVSALISAALNPITWLILGIAALYTAWQTNFLGIQDITRAVITAITDYFNNVLKPAIDFLVPFITDAFQKIALQTKFWWDMVVAIISGAITIARGILLVVMGLITGDWRATWDGVKMIFTGAWEAIKGIFNSIVEFIKGWGGIFKNELTKPFREAWDSAKEAVEKIKGLLDFTKRSSPSVVDIVTHGVREVNRALSDLAFTTNITSQAAALSVSNQGPSTNIASVTVDMAGAFIGDPFTANEMGEKVGDAIIRKLQTNVRF